MSTTAQDPPRSDDAALDSLLERLVRTVPADAVDRVWIFPPRRAGRTESRVIVLSAFDEESDRRRIFTGHYSLRRPKKGKRTVEHDITEHGSAPAARIGRVVDGVLRRLDDELAAAPPRSVRIAGDPDRWSTMVDDLLPQPDSSG